MLSDKEIDAQIEKELWSYWSYGAIEQDRLRNVFRAIEAAATAELRAELERVQAERDKLLAALRKHVLVYQIDDQEWDREKAADSAVARMLNATRTEGEAP